MLLRLNRYTPLRYRVNYDSQLLPALFVSKFTIVGHDYLSEEIEKFPLFVNDQSSNIDSDSKTPAVSFLQVKNDDNKPLDYLFTHNPICNHTTRIYSNYNINFTSCIVDCFDIANMSIEPIAN